MNNYFTKYDTVKDKVEVGCYVKVKDNKSIPAAKVTNYYSGSTNAMGEYINEHFEVVFEGYGNKFWSPRHLVRVEMFVYSDNLSDFHKNDEVSAVVCNEEIDAEIISNEEGIGIAYFKNDKLITKFNGFTLNPKKMGIIHPALAHLPEGTRYNSAVKMKGTTYKEWFRRNETIKVIENSKKSIERYENWCKKNPHYWVYTD